MNLKEFILKLGCLGFDIAALYTDYTNGERHCHIIVTQRDDSGVFFRSKCHVHKTDEMLEDIIKSVRSWQDNGEL